MNKLIIATHGYMAKGIKSALAIRRVLVRK